MFINRKILKLEKMIKPLPKNFKGLITISGPTKSGKSQLAEYLIKDQRSITYIATSKPRENDPEWEQRIMVHKDRRPDNWKLLQHPHNLLKSINRLGKNESILIDSLGGLVEQYLKEDNGKWELFQSEFVRSLIDNNLGIILVADEIGWGIVPSTQIGHLFRERHCKLLALLSSHASKRILAVNGIGIDLDKIGFSIP